MDDVQQVNSLIDAMDVIPGVDIRYNAAWDGEPIPLDCDMLLVEVSSYGFVEVQWQAYCGLFAVHHWTLGWTLEDRHLFPTYLEAVQSASALVWSLCND